MSVNYSKDIAEYRLARHSAPVEYSDGRLAQPHIDLVMVFAFANLKEIPDPSIIEPGCGSVWGNFHALRVLPSATPHYTTASNWTCAARESCCSTSLCTSSDDIRGFMANWLACSAFVTTHSLLKPILTREENLIEEQSASAA